jgi:hypothetical protein
MTTSFPANLDSFTTNIDGVDTIFASDVNNLQDSVAAIEGILIGEDTNYFINGGFDLWQRTTNDTGVTTTRKYVADRWGVQTGAGTLTSVARSTTLRTGARSKYSLQLTGAAGVTTVNVSQRLESSDVGRYKTTVCFSCYIHNVTGAAFTPKLMVSTPSSADNWGTSTVRNGGGSGEDLQECANNAWTQVYWTADVSGYTNIDNGIEFRIQIPSGSMVASDVVRIAEACLISGSRPRLFVGRAFAQEVALCQRFFSKSFALAIAPGTASSLGSVSYNTRTTVASSTAGFLWPGAVRFPAEMRTTPSVVIYALDGTANAVSVSGVVRTGVTATSLSSGGIRALAIDNTSATAITADAIVEFHWVADAEL